MNEILRETLLAGDPVYNDLKDHYRYLDFEHVRGKAQTICTPFTEEHISKRIIETQITSKKMGKSSSICFRRNY